jgi:hypothetical protein
MTSTVRSFFRTPPDYFELSRVQRGVELSWVEYNGDHSTQLNPTQAPLYSKNLNKTQVLFVLPRSIFFFFWCLTRDVKGTRGCLQRGRNNRQSLPWGFLVFRSPERCVWADRSRFLDPTGKGACQMKKVVYYESRKRELKTKLIYENRCDERLKN